MRRSVLIGCLGLLAALSGSARAHEPSGAGKENGWGPDSTYTRMYRDDKQETHKGQVLNVQKIPPMKGMTPGYQLPQKTDAETRPVELGPAWFLMNQEVVFRKGDNVEVKGARVTFNDKPAIIASQVQRGIETAWHPPM